MSYIVEFFLFGLVFGLVGVAANPSPFFAAFSLVVVAIFGCVVLAQEGGVFLSLILFLIYLGGMLVVFAYSAALAADPHPESLGDSSVMGYMAFYLAVVIVGGGIFWEEWHEFSWGLSDPTDLSVSRGDSGGAAFMYSLGGSMLIISGWVLLLTLLVVLELTRGLSRGAMREV
uniref:NADH dehydrogenase subunit 6 n=1 Tax=Chaetodon auriga TaxID=39042 RepID=UPI002176D0DD|nr:NADH dehydrogenase subunit 6 [Chaetodon auriga]UUJ37681.1 NADH dehydrogenase subunit 6 [Chaetodon auriga]WNH17432.1 NADH dehydrogenase subunit 6 [Chaetodon auriga]